MQSIGSAANPASAIVHPRSAAAGAAPSAASGSATVTANDFLQLLVTELRNQDPTANTDPNEYINQLVQVNSLQQLISINQELGGSSPGTSNASASARFAANTASEGTAMKAANLSTGNLSLPAAENRSQRLSRALEAAPLSPATGRAQPEAAASIAEAAARLSAGAGEMNSVLPSAH